MFRPEQGDAPRLVNPDRLPEPGADSDVPSDPASNLSPPPVAAELVVPPAAKAPARLAWWGIGLGFLGFAALLGLLLFLGRNRPEPVEAEISEVVEPSPPAEEAAAAAPRGLPGGAVLASTPRPAAKGKQPSRIDELERDPSIRLVRGTMKRRSLLDALGEAGIPRGEIFRIIKAFEGVKKFDRAGRLDKFTVAIDKDSKKVRAFEYEVSPAELYQARENEQGLLRGKKIELELQTRRIVAAVRVGNDLVAACKEAGIEPAMLGLLSDALENRLQLTGLHPNGILRFVAEEESANGKFVRYRQLEAVEYIPPKGGDPLRIYRYEGKKERGYFDAKGQAPSKSGWRSPVPFARISSRFNPKRRHPVLKKIKPHNGVDFAAPTGTPVYAPYPGVVEKVGMAGPNGNLITIRHEGDIVTGYAHLSRFAPGIKPGVKVKTRQVIGYVGSTGRSTGPHLHFSAKKRGKFIDPLSLRLDALRVLPSAERAKFQRERAKLDEILDAIPLPAPVADEGAADEEPMGEEEEHEEP